jgi:hypothetical protein
MDAIDFDEVRDPRREIARLEAEIEELSQALERSRKIGLFARLAMAAGAIWLALAPFGVVRSDAPFVLGALAAVIGGIVLFGSNGSTIKQTEAAIEAAEAKRATLIGQIGLRVVHAGPA